MDNPPDKCKPPNVTSTPDSTTPRTQNKSPQGHQHEPGSAPEITPTSHQPSPDVSTQTDVTSHHIGVQTDGPRQRNAGAQKVNKQTICEDYAALASKIRASLAANYTDVDVQKFNDYLKYVEQLRGQVRISRKLEIKRENLLNELSEIGRAEHYTISPNIPYDDMEGQIKAAKRRKIKDLGVGAETTAQAQQNAGDEDSEDNMDDKELNSEEEIKDTDMTEEDNSDVNSDAEGEKSDVNTDVEEESDETLRFKRCLYVFGDNKGAHRICPYIETYQSCNISHHWPRFHKISMPGGNGIGWHVINITQAKYNSHFKKWKAFEKAWKSENK
jgi:hypothetical protein